MKVFVAKATGAIGSQLVPQLSAAGHDAIGMTRSPAMTDDMSSLGARPVVADALDPDASAVPWPGSSNFGRPRLCGMST